MRKKYQSRILESIYEDAEALFEIGAISKEEMGEYARDCLVHEPVASDETYSPERNCMPIYAAGSGQ